MFINHVAIRTPDLHLSVDFYVNVLDMKVSAIDNQYKDNQFNDGRPGYKSTFLMNKENNFEIEIIENLYNKDFEKANCLDHFGFRACKRKDFNRAFIMADRLGFENYKAVTHHSHGKIYLIGWINSPEGVKINVVYKTDEFNEGCNGE